MVNLFYSTLEKRLFWVAGYTCDLNTSNVSEIIKSITENTDKFLVNAGWNTDRFNDVRTSEITTSSRYKRMRVFWIDEVKEKDIPKESFVIGKMTGEPPHQDDWQMWTWLNN